MKPYIHGKIVMAMDEIDNLSLTKVAVLGDKAQLPVVKLSLTQPPKPLDCFVLRDAEPVTFELRDRTVAVARFTASELDLEKVPDLAVFFRRQLELFSQKSGFTAAQKQGEVFGVTAPTYRRPGSDREYFRQCERPGTYEFRLYTDFCPPVKAKRKKAV